MVGFLNGSGEVEVDKIVNYVYDKEGNQLFRDEAKTTPKSFQTYSNWTLKTEVDGLEIKVKDNNRGDLEPVGGTNPSGYPKLYYFLIPKNCSSLLIPVSSGAYYLTKYTSNQKIAKYIELAAKIANSKGQDKIDFNIELLKYRTDLKLFSSISSLELDLVQKLSQDPKTGAIIPKISAIAHLQFSNPVLEPREYDEEKEKMLPKKEYSINEVKSKFKSILSIDLGEKHLAVANLQKINWDTKELSKESIQFYLPLEYASSKIKSTSKFESIINYNYSPNFIIDASEDSVFLKFDRIVKKYKQSQKEFGSANANLRFKKNNFTDQMIEIIATQIAKIAKEHNSFVVFERLETGFSSRKLEITTCTEIFRSTYNKLTKIGITLASDEKYISFKPKIGIARINPWMTSQTCSNCNYIPLFYKENSKLTESQNNAMKDCRLSINSELWTRDGKIEFSFGSKKIAEIQEKEGILEVMSYRSGRWEVDSTLNSTKHFKKEITNFICMTKLEYLSDGLITKNLKQRAVINQKTNELFKSTLLKPRLKQDIFICPCCGLDMNADYNASKNIAKKFIDGLED